MLNYNLPTDVIVDGTAYKIRNNGDFRVMLDLNSIQSEEKLDDRQKAILTLRIFFQKDVPNNYAEAFGEIRKFVNCGKPENEYNREPPITDLVKDFPLYIGDVNKALGFECRGVKYLHWWSWMANGFEKIDGNSFYGTVISIRQKMHNPAKYGKLEKHEQAFLNDNREIVVLENKLSAAEKDFLFENGLSADD